MIATYKNGIIYDSGIIDSGDRNYQIFSVPSPTCDWNSTTKANHITGRYFNLNHIGGEGPYIDKDTNGSFASSDNWSFGDTWLYDDGIATQTQPRALHLAGGASTLVRPIEVIVGRTYTITYTVSDWKNSGQLYCRMHDHHFTWATNAGTIESTVLIDNDCPSTYTSYQKLEFYTTVPTVRIGCSITNVKVELLDIDNPAIKTVIYSTDFTYKTGWTIGGDWFFGNNKMYHTCGGTTALTCDLFAPTIGKEYYVEFAVIKLTGTVSCTFGGQTVVSGLTAGGVFYKVIAATTTAGLSFTCQDRYYASISNIVIKELDNYLDFTLDMSNSRLDTSNSYYPYFTNLNYSKQIIEYTIIALSNLYGYKTWYTGVDHESGRTDNYQYRRSLLTFDDTSDYTLEYLDDTYTYFRHDETIPEAGTYIVGEQHWHYTNTIDTNNYDGYDLHVDPIVLNGFDSMFAIFPGKKSEQVVKDEYEGVHEWTSGGSNYWSWIVRNRKQWVKYATAKVFKFDATGTTTYEVCDEVLNLETDYYTTPYHTCATAGCGGSYPSGNDEYLYYSGYGSIFTQTYKTYQVTQTGDLFWGIYYYYTTDFYFDLAGSAPVTVRKLRFYKNGTFLEEIDVNATGDEFNYCHYYLGENDQIFRTNSTINSGNSILDLENNVLATPYNSVYYSVVNLIYLEKDEGLETEQKEYIVVVVDDIQGEGNKIIFYRYDILNPYSEWTLVESRNVGTGGGSDIGGITHNVYNYFANNGDSTFAGGQALITNPMFKCIGGFRSVKQSFLFGNTTPTAGYGLPYRYLGFAQSVLPYF